MTQRIQDLQDQSSALDPRSGHGGITKQVQDLRDTISGLNTDELDGKINKLRDNLNQPAPETMGITRQLVALQAQIQGTTDAAGRREPYCPVQRPQRAKGRSDPWLSGATAGDKLGLKALEDQKRDAEPRQPEDATGGRGEDRHAQPAGNDYQGRDR